MTLRNRFSWRAAPWVFAVLLAGGLAGAQKGQKTAPSSPPVRTAPRIMMDGGTKDIDSGKHHEKNKGEGPLVLTWKMTQRRELPRKEVIKIGNVNLTLNSDGSWNFSGQMNETDVFGTDFRFYIVMAVRSSEGTSVLFSHSDVVRKSNPESYSWQKQGNNPTIKDNFKSFKEDLDWAGHWTCVFALAEVGHGGRNDPNLQRSCLFVKNAIPGVNCKGI